MIEVPGGYATFTEPKQTVSGNDFGVIRNFQSIAVGL